MAVYMKVEGVTGDASQEAHAGWIPLTEMTLPTERPDVNTAPGNVSDRTTSAVNFNDLEISKSMDKASPQLMTWNIDGSTKKVIIEVCKEKGQLVLQLVLYDVILTNYSSTSDEEGAVTESINLDYTKIEYNYTPYTKDNVAGDPIGVEYDLETAG